MKAKLHKESHHFVGGHRSPAASLDYAISKKPVWLQEMFGTDRLGRSIFRRVVHRRNTERKAGDFVSLVLNPSQISIDDINLMADGDHLTEPQIRAYLQRHEPVSLDLFRPIEAAEFVDLGQLKDAA
jgi:hypothetical protein